MATKKKSTKRKTASKATASKKTATKKGKRTPPRPKHTRNLPAGLAAYWKARGVPF